MAFSTGSSSGTSAEINVTPLVDVLLVLLIIFMVIGPKLPHGLDSSLPQKSAQPAAKSPQPVTVRILAVRQTGVPQYQVDGQETSFAGLRPALERIFATRPANGADRAMFVAADRGLSYRDVALVAAEGRAAGAGPVGLLTGEDR